MEEWSSKYKSYDLPLFMQRNNWFTVKRITKSIYGLAEFHHFERVVSYLVLTDCCALLFDTGMGYADIHHVVKEITSLPLIIFLTHTHWDHVGGIHRELDFYVCDDTFEKKLLHEGFTSKDIPELTDQKFFDPPYQPKTYKVGGTINFKPVHDGDEFTFSDITITVIHTPGHTPGSVCYYLPEHDVLVAGDTLYPGPLYAHLPESNIYDYARSLNKLVEAVFPDTLILPGHNRIQSDVELLKEVNEGFKAILSGSATPAVTHKEYKKYKFPRLSVLVKP